MLNLCVPSFTRFYIFLFDGVQLLFFFPVVGLKLSLFLVFRVSLIFLQGLSFLCVHEQLYVNMWLKTQSNMRA